MDDDCPVCAGELSRRGFIRTAGAAAASALLPFDLDAAADAARAAPETLAKELFGRIEVADLTRLREMVHRSDAPMASEVHASWQISHTRIAELPPVERSLAVEILKRSVSRDAYRRFRRQMREDWEGIGNYSCGFIGRPGERGFQFVIAGRHFTIRVDGAYDDRLAFGGPILYGHAEERRAEKNIWHDHALRATRVYEALSGAERAQAVVRHHPPQEFEIKPRKPRNRDGVKLSALAADQRALAVRTILELLSIYGERAAAEADRIVRANGGWGELQLAFYSIANLHDDATWDVWRVEGPGFLYFFRGVPHVHAYINIFEVDAAR